MIKSIRIKKFRQLENVNEENIGLINELYGSNGSGKTSFICFVTWMLYGETLDYGCNDDMNIDTFKPFELISGEIECDNNFMFKREYGYDEKGKKINNYYINDRKVSKQEEYYSNIKKCFNVNNIDFNIKSFNVLKAISNPYYLPNNENIFRVFIEKLLNLDTYSILFEKEKYQEIKNDYDNQLDFDKTKDYYKQQLVKINNDINITINSIDEIKALKFNQKEYDEVKNNIENLKNTIIKNDDEVIKLDNQIQEEYLKLNKSKENDKEFIKKQFDNEINGLIDKYNDMVIKYNETKSNNEYTSKVIELNNQKINDLQKEYDELYKQEFKKIKCDNCGNIVNDNDYRSFVKNKNDKLDSLKKKIKIANEEKEKYVINDLDDLYNDLVDLQGEISSKKNNYEEKINNYISDETNLLITEINDLEEKFKLLLVEDNKRILKERERIDNEVKELEEKFKKLEYNYYKNMDLEIHVQNKKILLENKSIIETRLQKLNDYKEEEINLIRNKTNEIFGKDFTFEMLVKNKTNDNYRKVCYASVGGLEHNKLNTAEYLKISILMIEKLKEYIGGCNLPYIFDICDNIGKKARQEIFEFVKSSQIFYTKIADEDNVERKINIIKEL